MKKIKCFKVVTLLMLSIIMFSVNCINSMSYNELPYYKVHYDKESESFYNVNINGIYYNIDIWGKEKGKEIYSVQAFYPITKGDILKIPEIIKFKGKKYKVEDISLSLDMASFDGGYNIPKLPNKLVLSYKTIYLPKCANNFYLGSDVKFSNLKKIYVPKQIKDLVGFSEMSNVKVIIDKNNPYIKMKNEAIYSKNGKTLIRLVNKKKVYRVAKGTKDIELTGFDCVKSIEKVYLPASMKKISDGAFDRCKKLKMVKINNKTTKIGDFAFEKCKSLNKIVLPKKLDKIGLFAFKDCINLSKVTLEGIEKVPTIEKASFKNTKDGIQFIVKNQTVADQLKEQLTGSGVKNAKILIGKKVVYKNING